MQVVRISTRFIDYKYLYYNVIIHLYIFIHQILYIQKITGLVVSLYLYLHSIFDIEYETNTNKLYSKSGGGGGG